MTEIAIKQTAYSALKLTDSQSGVRQGDPARPSANGEHASNSNPIDPLVPAGGVQQNDPLDPLTLGKAVRELNDHVQSLNRQLQFNVDEPSGRVVIKVIDSETEEVVRQIPPEDVLDILHALKEQSTSDDEKGLIFNTRA